MDCDHEELQMARICFDGRELRRRSRSRTREPNVLDCTSTTMNRTTDFLDAADEEELCLLGVRERPYVIRTAAERRNLIGQTVADVAQGVDKPIDIDEVEEDLHCFDLLREDRPLPRRRFRFNWKNCKEATISKDILSTICQRAGALSNVTRAKMDRRDYKILKSSLSLTEEYLKMMQNENSGGDLRHDRKMCTTSGTIALSQANNVTSNYRKGRLLSDITKKVLPTFKSFISGEKHHVALVQDQTASAVLPSNSLVIKKRLILDEKPSDLREILAFIDNTTDPKDDRAKEIDDNCRTTSLNLGNSFGLATIKYEVNSQAIRSAAAEKAGSSAERFSPAAATDAQSILSSDDDEDDFWGCIDKKFSKGVASSENRTQVEKVLEYENDYVPNYMDATMGVSPCKISDHSVPTTLPHRNIQNDSQSRDGKRRTTGKSSLSSLVPKPRKVKEKKCVTSIGRKLMQSQSCVTGSETVVRRRCRPPKNSNQATAKPLPKAVSVKASSMARKNINHPKKEKASLKISASGQLVTKKEGRPAKYKKVAKPSTEAHRSDDLRVPSARSCKSNSSDFTQFF